MGDDPDNIVKTMVDVQQSSVDNLFKRAKDAAMTAAMRPPSWVWLAILVWALTDEDH